MRRQAPAVEYREVMKLRINNLIWRIDDLEPNQYSDSQKMKWLSLLDGQIFEEIIKTHEDPIRESFSAYIDGNEELLVPYPYGEELYSWYLQAMIAAENAESDKYDQMMGMYNSVFTQFANWYNRTHRPKKAETRFLF